MDDERTDGGMGTTHDHDRAGDHEHEHDPAFPSAAVAATPPAAAAQTEAMRKRWEVLGPNQRLTVAGGVAILVAYLTGVLFADWDLRVSSFLLLACTVVTVAVVLIGTSSAMGASRTAILRIDAGVVGAYSLYDLGDLISGLTFWSVVDLVLAAVAVIGAGLLVFGVWRMTDGHLAREAIAALTGRGRDLPARLVSVGSVLLIGVWLVLAVLNYAFRTEVALAVLAAVLSLTVLWLAGSGAAEMKLPVAANLALAVTGVIVGALAVVWLLGLIENLDRVDAADWPFVLIFLASAAAMTVGGLLGVGSRSADTAT